MWYHVSDTLIDDVVTLHPRPVRSDDGGNTEPCICVCPSVAQCMIALGALYDYDALTVYQTSGFPKPCPEIFDFCLTQEHRFYDSTTFTKIGNILVSKLDLPKVVLCGIPDNQILANARIVYNYLLENLSEQNFSDNRFDV